METLSPSLSALLTRLNGAAVIYGILLGRKIAENLAYLLFLTREPPVSLPSDTWLCLIGYCTANLERWFLFRVWVKDFLKRLFTCNLSRSPAEPVFADIDVDDR